MDGVISEVNGFVNEYAAAGTPFVVMSSGQADAEVEIGIPEGYINEVRQGQNVEVKFLATGEKIHKGVVTEVAYSTAGASTYLVTVKITDNSVDIRPGMAGKVKFQFGSKDDLSQMIVPLKAVGDDPNGNFVFLLVKQKDHYLVKKTKVEIGALVSEGFIVQSGLNEGDYVAVAGTRSLFDGKKVTLLK
jgi:RND family efflux transporter MFP subunit